MSRLRVKLGAWLLGPLLRREIRLAYTRVEEVPEKQDYWMGRMTGATRIYRALTTRDEYQSASDKRQQVAA